MLFKGTEKRTARKIAEDMERIGATFNAMTGKEATCFYVKTLTPNIYKGAEILIDMITGSLFDPVELAKEREVIIDEIKMSLDIPDDVIFDDISELIYGKYPLGKNIAGSPESLSGIDAERMVEYFRNRYAREGIVIAVAGNFDEKKIIKMFEDKFRVLNEKLPPRGRRIWRYKKSNRVRVREIEQSYLCLAAPGISYNSDLYYAFSLMNSIFGGSMSSRLFQNIREKNGLAYAVSSMNCCSSNNGFFNIYANVQHENVPKTIQAVRRELEKLANKGVTKKELDIAKEQTKSTYIFSLENPTALMMSLGRNALLLDRLFSVDESLEKYNAVTREDILKAAEMIGSLDDYCVAAITRDDLDLEELIDESKGK